MTNLVRLYLIRHGRPTAGFAEAVDPGLDEIGKAQAANAAQALASLGPLALATSPLKRARETAAPFEALWETAARPEPAVAEIPTPMNDPRARSAWLRDAMRGQWTGLPEMQQQWREQLIATLTALPVATVITTHFIAINAAVGAATGDARMICCEPDHCSCTVLEVRDRRLYLVSLGKQRETQIL